MAGARDDGALRSQPVFQNVADRVECRVVSTRDDELGEGRAAELVEWDLGLPRASLEEEDLGAALEARRERIGQAEVRADELEEGA